MTDDTVIDPIVAAIQSGDPARAERLCRNHLANAPDESDVLLLLGLSLQRQGRCADAVTPYRRLTELHPDDASQWENYATALRLAGDMEAAVQASETVVRLTPDAAGPLEQLGLLQLETGKVAEARDNLLRAWDKAPDSAAIRIHAARACVACHDSRAETLLQQWREWLALDNELQLDLADLLTQTGELRGAIAVLDALLQRAPGDVPARLLLAKSYERVNRLDEARAVLRNVVASGAAADAGVRREVARQNANLAVREHAYGAARTLLEQLGEDGADDCGHFFTLGKVCDRLGDFDGAMRALAVAHARQVEDIRRVMPHVLEPGASALPRADDRVRADDYRAWPQIKGPDAAQSPLFVVGFPRSGTTLLEQMLDAHPRLQSMDERPFFNRLAGRLEDVDVEIPQDLGRLDQRDCDELRKGYLLMACGKIQRSWDTKLVDKNPLNMLWLPMIHRMYPQAQFILALRHPCDVILSCYMQNFRSASLSVAGASLESLARAYVAAMQAWLYHAGLMQPDVFISRYEDLVADTPAQTRRIAAFLGFDDAAPMLHYDERAREKGFIATPSYTQVIEPVNARAVGRWRRYQKYFEPILPILEPMIRHWGYDARTADPAAVG